MEFTVQESTPSGVSEGEPSAVLEWSEWDDYNVRTQFTLYLAIPDGNFRRIGKVKILAKEYPDSAGPARTIDVIPTEFEALNASEFCSLGQTTDYYEMLGEYRNTLGQEVLSGLNDICFSDEEPWWEEERKFKSSLLRYQNAYTARREAKARYEGRNFEGDMENEIHYDISSAYDVVNGGTLSVGFNGHLEVPGRLNVIVGKNGSGKTSLLAGLAYYLTRSHGDDGRPEFSSVIVATYNQFDHAYIDTQGDGPDIHFVGEKPISESKRQDLKELCGLLKNRRQEERADESGRMNEVDSEILELIEGNEKALEKVLGRGIANEAEGDRLQRLTNDERWERFLRRAFDDERIIEEVLERPSSAMESMSAGQRMLLDLYSEVFEKIDSKALIIIDEVENHLHPSLISRFVKSFNELLSQRKAFGIISTHSPVVVQETPTRFVRILERDEMSTYSRKPNFETFGESIDTIVERIFDTDFRSSNWKKVLRDFAARGLPIDEVTDKISGESLSMYARAYYEYQKSISEGEA
jgi:predicted ATPase